MALAGGLRCTKHCQFGEIPSGFSGRLVMVVTVTRLEPGHCTAVSYDSHAWWGSCERPMSDVTSLVRCAQPQGTPGPALSCPCRVLSSPSQNTYPTHRATRAMGGVAWSGVVWSGHTRGCSPGRFLQDSTCNTSQAAGILERMNKHRLWHMLHPLFPSDCQLRWLQHIHKHAHTYTGSAPGKRLTVIVTVVSLPCHLVVRSHSSEATSD